MVFWCVAVLPPVIHIDGDDDSDDTGDVVQLPPAAYDDIDDADLPQMLIVNDARVCCHFITHINIHLSLMMLCWCTVSCRPVSVSLSQSGVQLTPYFSVLTT